MPDIASYVDEPVSRDENDIAYSLVDCPVVSIAQTARGDYPATLNSQTLKSDNASQKGVRN